jgi:hypothetical protein
MSTDASLRNIHRSEEGVLIARKDFKLNHGCFILKHLRVSMAKVGIEMQRAQP